MSPLAVPHHPSTTVTKAVIPTTFDPSLLPATKAVPQELLPIAGIPTIERIVAAASRVGINDVLVISHAANRAIEDHFDRDPALERGLAELDDRAGLVAIRQAAGLATVHSRRQGLPLGLGDAVQLARPHVGDGSFVVLAPNRLVAGDSALVADLVDIHERSGLAAVAVRGDLDLRHVEAADLEWYGRCVVGEEIFEALAEVPRDRHGRRCLGEALLRLLRRRRVTVVRSDSERCDLGDRIDRLRTELQLMLADPTWGDQTERVMVDSLNARGHDRPDHDALVA